MGAMIELMLEDFRMIDKYPAWRKAIVNVCNFAEGRTVGMAGVELHDRPMVIPLLTEVVKQLHDAMPEVTPHATTILMKHERIEGALVSMASTNAASEQLPRAKKGAEWKPESPNE
eukprot:5078501-Prymnesium_polylepis.1